MTRSRTATPVQPPRARAVRSRIAGLRRAAATVRQAAGEGVPFPEPGWLASTRVLALAGVAAWCTASRDLSAGAGLVWTSTLVAIAATQAEPRLGRLLPRPQAYHLPGYVPQTGPVTTRALAPVGLKVPVVLGVVTAADLPGLPWWWVGVVGVYLAVAAAAVLGLLGLRRSRGRHAQQLASALTRLQPQSVLYTARGNAAYQLQMWLPLFERLGRPFFVLTRDPDSAEQLARGMTVPVVCRTSWRDLDHAVVPSLRAAFYVNSVAANADFVTYRQLRHVYLGHGESDKALSHHPAHAMYDQVFVAGHAAADRYARAGVIIPPSKLVVVGRPQSAAVAAARGPIGQLPDPVCLYAPTWSGYNADSSYSSLPQAARIVTALLRRPVTVLFRPHPFSRQRPAEQPLVAHVEALLAADAARTGRAHRLAGDGDFTQAANQADAMVTDLSSVITEFLHSAKPLAVYAVTDPDTFQVKHPVTRAAYLIDPGLERLDHVLDELLGPDPLARVRAAVLDEIAPPDCRGAAALAAFDRAVLALLDRPEGTALVDQPADAPARATTP